MTYRYCISLAFFVVPSLVFGQSNSTFSPKDATYLWPTNASHRLTSTFAETRAGHFHAALDLKTWGRRGYEVYATRKGILHRIAIGPKGYGKVVYLKHPDGSYSVYAHLMAFAPEIQQMADSIRFKDYSFTMDRVLDGLHIDIKQGQLIGISGASGIGPPHLHFELRTPDEKPFNPLLTNLKIQDHRSPQFRGLSIEPLTEESKIEGKNRIYTKRARRLGDHFGFGTVKVQGPVGLGVRVFDQSDKVHNVYAAYELKMLVDGKLLFHSRVDSFSYNETHQMFLDRVYPILRRTGKGYQRLYQADGNTLPFYLLRNKDSRLDLSAGTHTIRVIATDYFGNTSEADVKLRVSPEKKESYHLEGGDTEQETATSPLPDLAPGHWQWFDNWVNIPRSSLRHLTIIRDSSGIIEMRKNRTKPSLNLKGGRDIYFRRSSQDHFLVRRVYPESFSIVPSTTYDAFAAFPKSTFYDTLSVGLLIHPLREDSVRFAVNPEDEPIHRKFKLAFKMDSLQEQMARLAFYQLDKRHHKLTYIPTHRSKSYLIGKADKLGTYYVLQDSVPPVFQKPRILERPDGKWVVRIPVTDNLSGIDYKKAKIYVNGEQGLAEYAPEDDRFIYYNPLFTPKSENDIYIECFDRMGNRIEKHFHMSSVEAAK